MLNAYWEPLDFELPARDAGESSGWRRLVDTSLPAPAEVTDWANAPVLHTSSYRAGARSIVLLVSDTPQDEV